MENSPYIQNCDMFVTESMIESCFEDKYLIRQSALLEGAKVNKLIDKFFNISENEKECEQLRKDLQTIIDANNLDNKKANPTYIKIINTCNRIVNYILGLLVVKEVGIKSIIIGTRLFRSNILCYVMFYAILTLCSFILRAKDNGINYHEIKHEADKVIELLKDKRNKAKDPEIKECIDKEIEKVKKTIDKCSY